ncbi:MAG: MBL fold metallo-hydrolase [Arcobacteraceae bacterium]|nr:MBL fold metallo-hydrolase [Arcobacteraceae bacterium]
MNLLSNYKTKNISTSSPILLFEEDKHKIYWLGIDENTAFRCNVYMICDNGEYIIVDPGNRAFFKTVQDKVAQITDPKNIKALILCHQDPDVAASMVDWLEFNKDITIISSSRANVLLLHYGISSYNFYDIAQNNKYQFKSGKILEFIEAPFLHFAGAFTTLDKTANFLFSGDIWAALDIDWKLVVDENDFILHETYMDLFHIDYMASNIAARGFVRRLDDKVIEAILPQHGSLINESNVQDALNYLENLQCGTDIIYSDLED